MGRGTRRVAHLSPTHGGGGGDGRCASRAKTRDNQRTNGIETVDECGLIMVRGDVGMVDGFRPVRGVEMQAG